MKQLLILLTALTLTTTACKKDDDQPGNFQTPLPPATQTGAGTFACYVNGKPFIDTSGNFNCYYQLVDGKYYFNIKGKKNFINFYSIQIGSDNISLKKNEKYPLLEKTKNSLWGGARFEPEEKNDSKFASTSQESPGSLIITHLDTEKQIISGNFSFELKNPFTGEILQITQGRFDSYYSK